MGGIHRYEGKSTVPVWTCEFVSEILEITSGLTATIIFQWSVIRSSFEKVMRSMCFFDRIVIGTLHEQARTLMRKLYKLIVTREYDKELLSLFPFENVDKRGNCGLL